MVQTYGAATIGIKNIMIGCNVLNGIERTGLTPQENIAIGTFALTGIADNIMEICNRLRLVSNNLMQLL